MWYVFANKKQRLAYKTIKYYKQMKQAEDSFRKCKNALLACTTEGEMFSTKYGELAVRKSHRLIIDFDKLVELVPPSVLSVMCTLKIAKLLKYLGPAHKDDVVKDVVCSTQAVIKLED